MAGFESAQPEPNGSLALNYSVSRDVISRQWTGQPMEDVESTAFMPPFTVHTCCDPQIGSTRGNFIISHSVPPFYVPIPSLIPTEKENMTVTKILLPTDKHPKPAAPFIPDVIKGRAASLSSAAVSLIRAYKPRWQGILPHRLKNVGWAGAWLVIIFLLFLAYGNLPNRWYHILYVYSGSMAPSINPGDLIIITPPTRVLEPGMVLTMRVDGQLVTHRLLGISSDGMVITKGDANNTLDNWDQSRLEIGGIVRGRIPYLGYLSQVSGIFNQAAAGAWFADAHEIKMDISSGTWVFGPTAPHAGQSGTSITGDVTVEGVCVPSTRTLPEGVNPGLKKCEDLPIGEPGAVDEMEEMKAYGQVCVTNTGEVPTRDLKVLFKLQFKPEHGPYEDLTGPSFEFIPTEEMASGASRCYNYRVGFQPVEGVDEYKLSALVTITNHSGYLPGGPHCAGPDLCPSGPEPKATFTMDTVSPFDIPISIPTEETSIPLEITETSTPEPMEVPLIYIPTEIIEPPTEIPLIYDATEVPTDSVVTEAPVVEETPQP